MASDQVNGKYKDVLLSFEMGINSGDQPLLLPPNQLAFATNASVRGNFITHRPSFVNRTLNWTNPKTGDLFQGAGYYKPDSGTEQLMAQIGGRLFTFTPQADNSLTVADVTVPGDPNSATAPQAWMWQAEKWMIVQNGVAGVNPIFYDGTVSRRSLIQPTQAFNTTCAVLSPGVPAIGTSFIVQFTSVANLLVGDIVTIQFLGQFVVQVIAGALVTLLNTNCPLLGTLIEAAPNSPQFTWQHVGKFELPPGRMGCYGMGRNWMSLLDGKQFVASDLVGGSSGTQAENFRDAVLSITENTYLAGGGNFTVPGSIGAIRAMIFQAVLDTQLGQGPLLVVTPKVTFSCQAPVDRTTWTALQNPIVTEGMKANGGLGQNSTVLMNSDVIMRAIDGIRSMVLARRDFQTSWGNTPMSFELNRVLPDDQSNLLAYSSAIFFDNRLLMTVGPKAVAGHGVYHQGIVALNADALSSIQGKEPSVWEGVWLNLPILQLVVGDFNEVERAFAFCLNTTTNQIEVHEILKEDEAIYDDTSTPITMSFESPMLFKDPDPRDRRFKQLWNGDISVDDAVGRIQFVVQYRPDQYPGWVNWFAWEECVKAKDPNDPTTVNFKPGYLPRMGLGKPSLTPCDPCTKQPFAYGYNFQVRIQITGHCRFLGARFEAVDKPEPEFGKMSCNPICP